jgi:hypothetical protein
VVDVDSELEVESDEESVSL